ncbi:hypothetical protein JT305_12870 [Salmonella enterica subsp. enterica serovar Senftenberg]|nr:hypothetical protein [Salmonella enterica subsp. enterica serovar Senftenberg]
MKDNVASATARRASEASHPARPINVKRRWRRLCYLQYGRFEPAAGSGLA